MAVRGAWVFMGPVPFPQPFGVHFGAASGQQPLCKRLGELCLWAEQLAASISPESHCGSLLAEG